jgi:hypothetical protein
MSPRVVALVALLACLALAACGGDEEGGQPAADKPKAPAGSGPAAKAFLGCYDQAGYRARRANRTEQSVLSFQARNKGYDVVPVNVYKGEMITPTAFLVFFASPDKAKQAMKELDATAFGSVPPVQRGPAVIGYGDKENRTAVGRTVEGCVG